MSAEETRNTTADDRMLASAARFLIDGGEEDAASVLLSCALSAWESGDTWWVGDEVHSALHLSLTGPRAAYEILTDDSHEITVQVKRALEAVLPGETYIKHSAATFGVASKSAGLCSRRSLPGSSEPDYLSRAVGALCVAKLFRIGSRQRSELLELLVQVRPRIAHDPHQEAMLELRAAAHELQRLYEAGLIDAEELPPGVVELAQGT